MPRRRGFNLLADKRQNSPLALQGGPGRGEVSGSAMLLMRAHTLSIALTLTMAPLPAVAFDEDEFCTTVTEIARRMNSRAGRWLDGSTRHDGVEVDCGLKTLEAKRFLKATVMPGIGGTADMDLRRQGLGLEDCP